MLSSVATDGNDGNGLKLKIGGQVKASISWQELKNRFLRYFAHK